MEYWIVGMKSRGREGETERGREGETERRRDGVNPETKTITLIERTIGLKNFEE